MPSNPWKIYTCLIINKVVNGNSITVITILIDWFKLPDHVFHTDAFCTYSKISIYALLHILAHSNHGLKQFLLPIIFTFVVAFVVMNSEGYFLAVTSIERRFNFSLYFTSAKSRNLFRDTKWRKLVIIAKSCIGLRNVY